MSQTSLKIDDIYQFTYFTYMSPATSVFIPFCENHLSLFINLKER